VRGLKRKDPKQFDRLEFPPGEEAQVDYGKGAKTLSPSGKYRKPRLFVMTLKYSGRAFRKVVWKSSKETWARLHEEAFRYFGGCTVYVVLDNLKEGVIKPDIYEPELNPLYEAMLSHYEVVADPARVGDSDRKGTVENAIKYTQDTALKGRVFESIEEQNAWLMHWEERWAAMRIHGSKKRQVEKMFQEEKPYLKTLPLTSFRYFSQVSCTVWDDGTVHVDKSYYSALPAPLYSQVIVRVYDGEIEIIDPKTMEIIRRHIKSTRAGLVHMEEEDRVFNPSRQTDYLIAKAEHIGPATKKLCESLFQEGGRIGQKRMYGIVNLARHHKSRDIEEAAMMAYKAGLRSYQSIRKLVEKLSERNKKEKGVESNPLSQEHKLIRPPEDYAAFWKEHAAQTGITSDASGKEINPMRPKGRFVMQRKKLPEIWQNANWERVIEVFGLEVDKKRRCKSDEIWIKSPFTNEKRASLHVNLKENIFKDFSSGKGANMGILNFCQELLRQQGQEMDCYEVAGWMIEKGISVVADRRSEETEKNEKGKGLGSRGPLKGPDENRPIKVDLRRWLQSGHPELLGRGVTDATCQYLGCGFLPERPLGTRRSPLNGRVVFQVRGVSPNGSDLRPVILTHVGRALTEEQEKTKGKYWGYPFYKGLEIYNQDKLLLDPSARSQVEHFGLVLVEGFFDVTALVGSGLLNVGALMGAQMTDKQVTRLKFMASRVTIPKITILLDRDEAGISGSEKALSLLQNNGFSVDVFDWNLAPETTKDPGDMSVPQLKRLRQEGKI
jgi:hypothetical protein